MEPQYTQETQIIAFSEPKKVQTKYGEKDKWAFKDSSGTWYDVWGTEHRQTIMDHSRDGDIVVIAYQSGSYNGKETRAFKGVVPVRSQGSKTPQNAPGSTIDKEDSIARAVALKAAVELICADKQIIEHNGVTTSVEMGLFRMADKMLAWLKNEKKEPIKVELPEDPNDIANIPF